MEETTAGLEVALGAAPTNWGRTETLEFYADVLRRPAIRRIYVGEIACLKRELLTVDLFRRICQRARAAGRKVCLTTPPVLVAEQDIGRIAELADAADAIEANNVGVVALWKERFSDKELVLGPYLNVYNGTAARFWREIGAGRVVAPIDIALPVVSELAAVFPGATEMVLFGRPALGFSWRCYTARVHHKLGRDCDLNCYARREVDLETLDGERLIVANGPAVYPKRAYCAVGSLEAAREAGVSTIRIEPACSGAGAAMAMIDRALATIRAGRLEAAESRYDTEYMASDEKRRRLQVGGGAK